MELQVTLTIQAPGANYPAGLAEEIIGRLRLDERDQFETESDGLVRVRWEVTNYGH